MRRSSEGKSSVDSVTLAVRRRKLEVRYVNRKFLDGAESRVITGLDYESKDGVWVAVTRLEDGQDEQRYYLNAASGMDEMIEAYRSRERTREAQAIEVLWEVFDEETEETSNVWFRAEVLGKEGRHVLRDGDEECELDKWRIRYDARPELSQPDEVEHVVCFLSARALFDVTAADAVMQWRKEGATDEPADLSAELSAEIAADDPPTVEGQVDHLVDDAVQAALEGSLKTKFDALPRDKQCTVADLVLAAKDKLKRALSEHVADRLTRDKDATVTPDDINLVLHNLKTQLDPTALDPAAAANSDAQQPAY